MSLHLENVEFYNGEDDDRSSHMLSLCEGLNILVVPDVDSTLQILHSALFSAHSSHHMKCWEWWDPSLSESETKIIRFHWVQRTLTSTSKAVTTSFVPIERISAASLDATHFETSEYKEDGDEEDEEEAEKAALDVLAQKNTKIRRRSHDMREILTLIARKEMEIKKTLLLLTSHQEDILFIQMRMNKLQHTLAEICEKEIAHERDKHLETLDVRRRRILKELENELEKVVEELCLARDGYDDFVDRARQRYLTMRKASLEHEIRNTFQTISDVPACTGEGNLITVCRHHSDEAHTMMRGIQQHETMLMQEEDILGSLRRKLDVQETCLMQLQSKRDDNLRTLHQLQVEAATARKEGKILLSTICQHKSVHRNLTLALRKAKYEFDSACNSLKEFKRKYKQENIVPHLHLHRESCSSQTKPSSSTKNMLFLLKARNVCRYATSLLKALSGKTCLFSVNAFSEIVESDSEWDDTVWEAWMASLCHEFHVPLVTTSTILSDFIAGNLNCQSIIVTTLRWKGSWWKHATIKNMYRELIVP
eukprot:TRINITY_DN2059_c0_g1_i1.p1 TRINITY_DN2059_c0_g1~~TRINITY_DN2059_c0_g1_i1.p1  ORF type:complete len:537 (-),score=144.08 TRINITY_DN2059_c0_g1_i1:1535-3145(-)